MNEPIREAVLLHEWLQTGDLGSVRPGSTRAQVLSVFGPPDDVSVERRGRPPRILRYGNVEVHFDNPGSNMVFLVFIDTFTGPGGAPSGGSRITIHPWVIHEGLLLPRFLEAAASVDLGVTESRKVVPDTTVLVTPGGVELGFIRSPEEASSFGRLAWLSQSGARPNPSLQRTRFARR